MAIAASTSSSTMRISHSHNDNNLVDDDHERRQPPPAADTDDDGHEQDVVMPGFRFHPTEEELVEFYLRRKVEGKPFNVEIITFLDLYRYDPWELPGLAAIGEKEWYFYVPRDRKYRNGDRPNRVTTSGYWKATGADRMIKTDGFRSIGLKKTLVFYSGKAPKGIRSSWIMNEYRLPHHETQRFQKGEISLCRVYKRAGVEDHLSLPRCLPITSSSRASHNKNKNNANQFMVHQNSIRFLGQQQSQHHHDQYQTTYQVVEKINHQTEENSTTTDDANKYNNNLQQQQPKHAQQHTEAAIAASSFFPKGSTTNNSSSLPSNDNINRAIMVEDDDHLNRLAVSYNQQLQHFNNIYASAAASQGHQQYNYQSHMMMQFSNNIVLQPQQSSMPLHNSLPINSFSDRLWEWNPIPEPTNRDFTTMSFK
ncbi:hypothetical protein K1719_005852 [Acacia pycnantha]|nr:hypothetical protein K1719_005852 [Acacia pycnantha]